MRSVLIVAQVSASFMLLIAAGLTLRSLMNVQSVDPGFRTENLLTFRADMSFDKFPLKHAAAGARQQSSAYWTDFEERLPATPGVIAVGGGGTFPLNETDPFLERLRARGHPLPPGAQPPQIDFRFATPDYFKTLGTAARRRTRVRRDRHARRPAGRRSSTSPRRGSSGRTGSGRSRIRGGRAGGGQPAWTTIVGVVADVRQQLDQRRRSTRSTCRIRQAPQFGTTWVVHSRLPIEEATRADQGGGARARSRTCRSTSSARSRRSDPTALAPRRVVVR